ncbi:MAG: hypothetical protein GWP91_25835 [Rhodobacterales bacterium]|nr:hypothetical protein [Rhodobacterales bacterium]
MLRARNRRGEIGRNEIIIGVAAVAVLLLITVPLALNSANKSARGELPLTIASIRTAQIEYQSAFGEYVACEAAPRAMHAVTAEPVSWTTSPGFKKLSWAPEGTEIYGAYTVKLEGDSFVINGACDVDGDGTRALFKASKDDAEAVMVSESSVY